MKPFKAYLQESIDSQYYIFYINDKLQLDLRGKPLKILAFNEDDAVNQFIRAKRKDLTKHKIKRSDIKPQLYVPTAFGPKNQEQVKKNWHWQKDFET